MKHEITEKQLNMRGKFGEYLSSNFGISPVAAITVIIGCAGVYVLLVKLRQWRSSSKEKRMIMSSKSLAGLYGGDLAWRRLNNYKAALANTTKTNNTFSNQNDLLLLKDLLAVDEQHLDSNNIQRVMEKLEMAGRDEGLKILISARDQHADKSFFLHEIELALVELLIYQGNPEEALNSQCLDYQRIQFDARPPLYKAIIHGMLGEWEEATNNWDEFVDVRDSLISIVGEGTLPAGRLHRTDFQKFKQKVLNLENEISNKKQ